MRILITGLIISILFVSVAQADQDKNDILNQKNDLKQMKKDVEDSRDRLDSLKGLEVNVQNEIKEYDQKITSNRKLINRLTGQLNGIKKDIESTETTLDLQRQYLDRAQRRYLGNIRQFYFLTRSKNDLLTTRPNDEVNMQRQIVYLASLADFEQGNVALASQYLAETVSDLDDLTGKKKEVASLKKKRETSYSLDKSRKSKGLKKLDQLRRKSMDEADRIFTLEKAVEEMEKIIARLEEEQQMARNREGGSTSSFFATLKGQLISPIKGKVVVPFGSQQDPVTKLKSFSPGITIQGRKDGPVYSVASGTVAYTGNLRGYGNFVIINHDNQYYTTYAGLDKMFVAQGQHLQAATKVGTAGDNGQVKFELRKGREPLDPIKWIRIESL